MKLLRFFFTAALALLWVILLNTRIGKVPPMGPFLDPLHGYLQNAPAQSFSDLSTLSIPALQESVSIKYDNRLVPHIFAKNMKDLAIAQGYVHARHRLWQMEFQTYASGGRLAEIFGPDLLEFDRGMRRKGLPLAAERALEEIARDPQMMEMLENYTLGANAYIESLTPRDYPLEYKLMGYAPEPWSPYKTALLLKYMGNYLTSREYDLEYSNMLRALGKDQFELLFSDQAGNLEPIVPEGTAFDFSPLDIDTPSSHLWQEWVPLTVLEKPSETIGSNNWAINGSKTASGNPILCSDPHLQMNLPALWYEMQGQAPGYNVYGVTLPGSPGIIIGFNENIAWGATNAGRDVKDWYLIKFTDEDKTAYQYGDEIRPVTRRVEAIKVKGQPVYYDTVLYTHYGPVVYDDKWESNVPGLTGLAQKWELLEPSNEMRMFFGFNTAENYEDYRAALSTYHCPAQNFVFACRDGDIAITQQGRIPARWPEQGKFIMDGSEPLNDWQGYIPNDQVPAVRNPERNYVSSANQHAVDSTYPYYTSGVYEYYRNQRINNRLDSTVNAGWEEMARLQNDNFNMIASASLPTMIRQLEGVGLSDLEKDMIQKLEDWDFVCSPEALAPVIYQIWFDTLRSMTWDEISALEGLKVKPNEYTLIDMMKNNPDHPFFDLKSTDVKERFSSLCVLAFKATTSKYEQLLQHDDSPEWYEYKATIVQHLARIPAFSRSMVHNGGYKHIVNATDDRQGPSWRMIVELGENVTARGIYPGGQSGDPGSPYYDNFINDWADGNYYELLFLKNEDERSDKILFTQELSN